MTTKSMRVIRPSFQSGYLFVFLLLMLLVGTSKANELTLAVNLGMTAEQAAEKYKPLVRYLGQVTGQRIKLQTSANMLAHWEMMRREGYDLVLDNPAFTAYRAAKMDYTVIGKLPDVLSFTLVTHVDEMMFEPDEMIGRGVATQASPAMTALRLVEIYSNPMRQPSLIRVNTHTEALELVMKGKATGAMVPTGMIAGYQELNPVYTTEQTPAPGISVSARVGPELRDKIHQGLLDAHKSPSGRAMLNALNVPNIENANNAIYAGMEHMLEGLHGY